MKSSAGKRLIRFVVSGRVFQFEKSESCVPTADVCRARRNVHVGGSFQVSEGAAGYSTGLIAFVVFCAAGFHCPKSS